MSLPRYSPMLAVPWPSPFDDPQWWFEVKWDGFRVLVEWDERIVLRSRRGNDLTPAFPELATLSFDRPTALDGEIVAFDESGMPSFNRLQQRAGLEGRAANLRSRTAPVTLVAFDLIHHGDSLTGQPLERRWERLGELDLPGVVVSEPIRGDGNALFGAVVARGLEGMVAKRADSVYRPGRRSPDWRKIAHRRQLRVVVGGYLPGTGGRESRFGSLLAGLWEDDQLRFVGAVGSGFDEAMLDATWNALVHLTRPSCPFADPAPIPSGALWVEPRLVALVEFREWTPDGRLRAPVFKGFLDEDPPTWEEEGPAG